MANIKKHLENIKGALFGKDVRSSIHDGIDAINKEVEGTTEKQNKLGEQFKNLVINEGNSNAEVAASRGSHDWLPDRLDNFDSQLEHIVNIRPQINIKELGAKGDGVTDDTQAFKDASEVLKANGGSIILPYGTYRISEPFSLYSNTTLFGNGSTIKLTDNVVDSVIKTNPSGTRFKNIKIKDIILDANYFGEGDTDIQKSFHTLFLMSIDDLTLENIKIINPVAWCSNILTCNNVVINNFTSKSSKAQQDGLHFVDTSNIVATNIICSNGDDAIGITIDNLEKIENITIKNAMCETVSHGSLLRLNQSDRSISSNEIKEIKDINVEINAIGETKNRGFSLVSIPSTSKVENITLKGVVKDTVNEAIRVDNCDNLNIDVSILQTKDNNMPLVKILKTNKSHIKISAPNLKTTQESLIINEGSNVDIKLKCNYVTQSVQPAIRLNSTSYINIEGDISNCNRGISIGSSTGASNRVKITNTFIKDCSSYAIYIDGNGNYVDCINNHFVNTKGIYPTNKGLIENNYGFLTSKKGVVTLPSGTHYVIVTHGLHTTPSGAILNPQKPHLLGKIYTVNKTSDTFTIKIINDEKNSEDCLIDYFAFC